MKEIGLISNEDNDIVAKYERAGAGMGLYGILFKVRYQKSGIINDRNLSKSYIVKYCEFQSWCFNRLNEFMLLAETTRMFVQFPKVYAMIKDSESFKNAIWM